jgi:hypothetical protein
MIYAKRTKQSCRRRSKTKKEKTRVQMKNVSVTNRTSKLLTVSYQFQYRSGTKKNLLKSYEETQCVSESLVDRHT